MPIGDIEQQIYTFKRTEEEKQAQTLAKMNNLPYVYLVNYPILADILYTIKSDQAKKYQVIAYLKTKDNLRVATPDPKTPELITFLKELEQATGLKVLLAVCSSTSFRYVIQLYQTFQEQAETKKGISISEEENVQLKEEIRNLKDFKQKIGRTSTTHLLDLIFAGAAAVDASDIHLEPQEKDLLLRYRIDGVLQNVANLPTSTHKTLLSRIKYFAKLKIDVSGTPQDGRFEANAGNQPVDIRVSTLPAAYGEAVVMRLLYRSKEFLTLEKLGFSADQMAIIQQAVSKPHGIIFNTGPTGSGKTTTLYAILQKLNKPGVKIINFEDPIEYRITGVEQTQVQPEKNILLPPG